MTYKFAKALLMGSVMTMGAFGLVACGDDSSSGPSNNGSGTQIQIPTTQDQIIQFTSVAATDLGGAGLGPIKLTGSVTVNATDTISSATPENIQFTSLTFTVGKVNGNSVVTTNAVVNPTSPVVFPTNKSILTFTEMGIKVDLEDPALTECGAYRLIITAKANDGTKDFENTQTVDFVRSEKYCAAAPQQSSSSVEQPTTGVVMTICPEIKANTSLLPGIDLATCTASASTTADIVLTKDGSGDYNITSGNGTLFSTIDNETMTRDYKDDYSVGYWPEVVNGRDALMSDFMYKSIAGTSYKAVNGNYYDNIFVAKTAAFNEATGDGFYAFAVTSATMDTNKDYAVTLKVYKKK